MKDQLIKEIIEKGIAGGYGDGERETIIVNDKIDFALGDLKHWAEVFLDPIFWQALGKACGWEKSGFFSKDYFWYERHTNDYGESVIHRMKKTEEFALRFHEINLTHDFDSAISWLHSLISNKE